MGYAPHKGRTQEYDYFSCLGRHAGRTDCDLPYLSLTKVEDAVQRPWTMVRFTEEEIAEFGQRTCADLPRSAESGSKLIADHLRR